MGTIASTMANVHRGKSSTILKADDFVLQIPKTEAQKEAEMQAELREALKNATQG